MNDEEQRQLARKLIRNLLAHGPMKGATLKLRMLADFETEAQTSFDAAFRIYPKFASFLAANDDLVEIIRPPAHMPGDITVRLRQSSDAARQTSAELQPVDARPKLTIRGCGRKLGRIRQRFPETFGTPRGCVSRATP